MKQDSPHRRIRTALEEISRLGRSALVGFVLASQSYDGRTIDTGVLVNIGWRLVGYAPSDMSREALGEHAGRFDLDTSKMLVDSEQTGTAVVISPGIDRFDLARGWYQNAAAVTAAVKIALQHRAQAGITPTETTRPPLRAVRVPAELAVAADLARTAQAQGAPIVATAAILDALDDDMTPHRLSHLMLGWTGHRNDRQNWDGTELRGPRIEHILAAVDRINTGGPLTVDQPAEA